MAKPGIKIHRWLRPTGNLCVRIDGLNRKLSARIDALKINSERVHVLKINLRVSLLVLYEKPKTFTMKSNLTKLKNVLPIVL